MIDAAIATAGLILGLAGAAVSLLMIAMPPRMVEPVVVIRLDTLAP